MGEFEKNLKLNKTDDEIDLITDEFIRLSLSFIPGGNIADSLLNFQGNLKRKRVIEFSASLKKILEEFSGRELHAADFISENFVDIMELVFKKILTINSNYKLERFRNILAKQIVKPIESHEAEKFIHILEQLQDVDLIILDKMRFNDDISYMSNFKKLLTGSDEIYDDDYKIVLLESGINIEISIGDIEFYVNRLTSLGLLKLNSIEMISSTNKNATKNYQTLLISNMGKKFLNYIEIN